MLSYKRWGLLIALAGALCVAPAIADVWDTSSLDDDDTSATDNEFVHGGSQLHDLAGDAGVADQDWFKVTSFAYSSHEVIMDGVTGDISNGQDLDRVNSAGTVITSGVGLPGGSAYSLSLRWENTTAITVNEFVRVSNAQCGTACNSLDQYSIRYFETSASIARYNNSGSQVTVLLLQNPATYTISGNAHFWSTAGTLVGTQPFTAPAHALVVVSTAGVTGATSGSITIAHNGRYGDLQGKAVALEPATGFSFDTPMVYRPN